MSRDHSKAEKVQAECADCGNVGLWTSQRAIDAGGKNRDPGEALCPSCSASRTVMIRKVGMLPNTMHQIQALKMVKFGFSARKPGRA